MKKEFLYYIVLLLGIGVMLPSCSEDKLSDESIIVIDTKEQNEFDVWLEKNYGPYNIRVKYRMEDIESDMDYHLIPATMEKSIEIAKLVQFLCLEAYDEIAGVDFMRMYFPKLIHLVGSPAYNNNGTFIAGTAEGGHKITLYNVNNVNTANITQLNELYFRTIHHEFAHILHQTINYTTDFKEITGTTYVGDAWSNSWDRSDAVAQQNGYISTYASKEADEDFVELIAAYVTNTEDTWKRIMDNAGISGKALLEEKFDIVYNYMLNSWEIDLDVLRAIVQRRSEQIGELDLVNL